MAGVLVVTVANALACLDSRPSDRPSLVSPHKIQQLQRLAMGDLKEGNHAVVDSVVNYSGWPPI